MKYSLGISNFLEEISRLPPVYCFPRFLCTSSVGRLSYLSLLFFGTLHYLSFCPLFFASLLFTAICKASSDSHFAFLLFFSWGWSWFLSLVQCHESPSVFHHVLSIRSSPLNLFLTSTVSRRSVAATMAQDCDWLKGATLRPRSGAVAERSNHTSKVRSCALLEQPWRDSPRAK